MSTTAFALWFGESPNSSLSGDDFRRRAVSRRQEAGEVPQHVEGDAGLIARIRAGDIDAFEALFRRLLDPLVDFSVMLGASREAGQDIVGDIFFAVWKNRAVWTPAHVKAYFFGAVRKRVYSEQQRGRRLLPLATALDDASQATAFIDHSSDAESSAAEGEMLARLDTVLATLPPLRRTVITLRLRDQLSYTEIAAALGLGENAAQAHGSRAMKAIRQALSDPGELEPR
jgi:RNA polymerase sigma factor (sigma-70 family)